MSDTIKTMKGKAHSYGKYFIAGLTVILFLSVLRASVFADVSEDTRIWFEISFILVIAILAEFLVEYLKQPTVMILLVLGVLISPSALSLASPYISAAMVYVFSALGLHVTVSQTVPRLVSTEGLIKIFAQLGAIFLLFKVGLHSEVSRIFNKKNFFVAFLGVVFPFVAGYYYAVSVGHGFSYAMFLGAALTATSVGVTVAVLQEFKVLHHEFAQVILGAAVIDDILGLLALSLVKNVPSGSLDPGTLAPFVSVLVASSLFVIGGIVLGRRIVSRYFDEPAKDGAIGNAAFLGMLVYVLSYSYVAEYIGLSAIVGAFLAGVTLNYSKSVQKISGTFYPLEAFFTPIFFISLGMLVDIKALADNLLPILAITSIAVVTKALGCGLATRLAGGSPKDGLVVGIGMIPRGEVALIIGLIGLTSSVQGGGTILTATEYSMIASMAFLTTLITPPMLQKAMEYGGYAVRTQRS